MVSHFLYSEKIEEEKQHSTGIFFLNIMYLKICHRILIYSNDLM